MGKHESTTTECFDDSTVFLKNEKNKEGTGLQSLEMLHTKLLPTTSLLFEVYLSTPVISGPSVPKH